MSLLLGEKARRSSNCRVSVANLRPDDRVTEEPTLRVKFPISPQLVEVGTDGAEDDETFADEECATVGEAMVVSLASCTPSVTVVGRAVSVMICLEAPEVEDSVLGGSATEREG